MNARPLAVAAAAVALAAGGPAFAAAPACNLVTDPRDDSRIQDVVPGRPGIDVVSADVATGSRNMVAVIRLASLEPDDQLRSGTTYFMEWELDGWPQAILLQRFVDGQQLASFDPESGNNTTSDRHPPKVVLDTKKGTITFVVPRKINKELRPKGSVFSNFRVTAEAAINHRFIPPGTTFQHQMTLALGGDEATSRKRYVDRARSCVKGV